jgi:ketosteroid isomerase-like protein
MANQPLPAACRTVAALSLLMCAACAATRPAVHQPLSTAELQSEVSGAERAFAATMAARDFKSFLGYVSEEAVFFGGGGPPSRGRAAVGAAWRGLFDGPQAPFSWEPDHVEVLDSGTLALSTGPVRDPDGKATARFNSIWRREADGRWRVVFDKGQCLCSN